MTLDIGDLSTISAALVGFGSVARHGHLPWYLNNSSVELAAVVEPTERGREVAQALLPRVPVFPDLKSMFEARLVTFVDITAHTSAHRELILESVAAGTHVISEKPFVTGLRELREIEEARRAGGLIIAACHNWYFAPAISRGLELLDEGRVGEPLEVHFVARRSQPARGAEHFHPTWRQSASEGGGIIGDLGYHGFYLISRIFGRPAVSVHTLSVETCHRGAAESSACVKLDYGGGKQADVSLSWLSDTRSTVLKIQGTHGQLIVEGNTLRLNFASGNEIEERFDLLTADSWHAAWTGAALDTFLEVTRRGDGDSCWREISWSVATLDAAHASAKFGHAVTTAQTSKDPSV